jgi:hypothetical protein
VGEENVTHMSAPAIPPDGEMAVGVGSQWKEREDGSRVCTAVGRYPLGWKGHKHFVGEVIPPEKP